MFQGWRFKLREAEEALQQGQLDEACKLLAQGDLRQFLPGKRLSTRVAGELAQRARHRVIQGELSSGWRDLESAKKLAGEIKAVLAARQEIIAIVLREAENHISAGDPTQAIALLECLERFGVQDEPVRATKEAARRFESARRLARHGQFAEAVTQVDAAAALRPELQEVTQKKREYDEKTEAFRDLTDRLHRAMAEQQWTQAASVAEQALELAPESRLARDVHRRAWAMVGARPGSGDADKTLPWTGPAKAVTAPQAATGVTVADRAEARFLLWVDGVGGFLVCLANSVVLGQATPDTDIEIPIQADLSRQHARISRQGDGYVVEPYHTTRVNGQLIRGKTLLSDGDEIALGKSVRVRFRQPHALSASARLEFISRHRTQPAADGVLLMAESCVLGPKWQNHVVCPDWQGDVVFYRRDGDLYCRAMDSIEIDGQLCDGRGQLSLNSHVTGSDFSMSLEELS